MSFILELTCIVGQLKNKLHAKINQIRWEPCQQDEISLTRWHLVYWIHWYHFSDNNHRYWWSLVTFLFAMITFDWRFHYMLTLILPSIQCFWHTMFTACINFKNLLHKIVWLAFNSHYVLLVPNANYLPVSNNLKKWQYSILAVSYQYFVLLVVDTTRTEIQKHRFDC